MSNKGLKYFRTHKYCVYFSHAKVGNNICQLKYDFCSHFSSKYDYHKLSSLNAKSGVSLYAFKRYDKCYIFTKLLICSR